MSSHLIQIWIQYFKQKNQQSKEIYQINTRFWKQFYLLMKKKTLTIFMLETAKQVYSI